MTSAMVSSSFLADSCLWLCSAAFCMAHAERVWAGSVCLSVRLSFCDFNFVVVVDSDRRSVMMRGGLMYASSTTTVLFSRWLYWVQMHFFLLHALRTKERLLVDKSCRSTYYGNRSMHVNFGDHAWPSQIIWEIFFNLLVIINFGRSFP
jgi:hypothetical protein